MSNSQVRDDTLSGGDRIFIECAKRWAERGHNVQVITCEEGYRMCKKHGLKTVDYILLLPDLRRMNLYLLYILRLIKGCVLALRASLNVGNTVIYSSSDFWPDSIPAWFLKMRFKKTRWIAGFYLFAPSPFSKESPYKGKRLLRGLLYYLSQIPVYWLIKKYADMVWVTNELDRWRFIDNKRLTSDRVIAVRGGVDTKTPALIPEPEKKEFDAVFIGRFHPQKGVLELIDIWRYVCERKKDAKLAMIGVGELEGEVKAKIKKYGLENSVVLFGFKDGIEKLKIFKDSKVVVHPATYDSGGMAACEAMACGLPGVSFDLPALRTYYPKGMLKTPCYDLKAFAENILRLLDNKELYKRLQKEALKLAQEWDWDKRAEELLKMVTSLIKNGQYQ
ncbi:MAG: glycosyltransferase family 4 protein [Thermofilum sp.]|uniref:glycosyltransferase family 4 protein n=1 Tax=Thermofilum sp. TaxID=1961369 RepID=UPI003180FB02